MPIIDLNADVGEECGDDATLLNIVTSANVAAGGHAGGDGVCAQPSSNALVETSPLGHTPRTRTEQISVVYR